VLTPAGLATRPGPARQRHAAAATHHVRRRMYSVVGGFIYQIGVNVRMIYLRTVIGRGNAAKMQGCSV